MSEDVQESASQTRQDIINSPTYYDTKCARVGKWFWGDWSSYLYSEERVLVKYWIMQTSRIILTSMLYWNTVFRIIENILQGDFVRSQFFFTTFGIYATLYSETILILTSFWTKRNGYDKQKRWIVNTWKHNNLAVIVTLEINTVITVVFWLGIYLLTGPGSRGPSSYIDHSLPMSILLLEFICVGWVIRYTYFLVYLAIALLYLPVNAAYSLTIGSPLYSSIAWDSYQTAVSIVAIAVVSVVIFVLYLLISRYRYVRYLRRKTEAVKNSKEELSSTPKSRDRGIEFENEEQHPWENGNENWEISQP